MKIHKEKEFKEAMTKTLHAYEALIEDPKGNLKKWNDYGDISKCHVCKVYYDVLKEDFSDGHCVMCPLNTMCGTNNVTIGCATYSYHYFRKVLDYFIHNFNGDTKTIELAAKARYDELIKHLDKYGLE